MKKEIYKLIKIGGLLSFVPAILFSGPLSGYFLGDYLVKKFSLSSVFLFIIIGIGFMASLAEAVRVIRFVFRIEAESKKEA